MRSKIIIATIVILVPTLVLCKRELSQPDMNIIFLHHSTGEHLWNGKPPTLINKVVGKISNDLAAKMNNNGIIPSLFEEYNRENEKYYKINELTFPKTDPYGWNNFPLIIITYGSKTLVKCRICRNLL